MLARCALFVLLLTPLRPVLAKDPPPPPPPAPIEDCAKILGVELRRGPARDLLPYLEADVNPRLRHAAIRALGRIGDRAGAPELLAKLLGGGDLDRVRVLQAAALSAAKSLEGPVAGHLGSEHVLTVESALEALGWIGGDTAATACAKMLHHPDPAVKAAAVEALGRCRKEGYLERCAAFAHHADAGVRRAAWWACWRLAGARKEAGGAEGRAWRGEPALTDWLARARREEADVQERLDALRVLSILMPVDTEEVPEPQALLGSDERLVQELLARFLARSERRDALVLGYLRGKDPKTREAAAEALAARPAGEGTPGQRTSLAEVAAQEPDPRVREAMAVALAKLGDEAAANVILERKDRPADLALRRFTEARVLAASQRPEALGELVALAQGPKQPPSVVLEALSLLEEKKAPEVTRFVAWALEHADPFVRAAAIGLVGKHGLLDLLGRVQALHEQGHGHEERDVRQAAVECYAELAKLDAAQGEVAEKLKEAVRTAALRDEAFTARAAARDAMKALGMGDVPAEDPLQPNDWQGLPRPKEPILGVDLTKGTGLLTEVEILTLADAMAAQQPEFVVQSDVGSFRLAIDPSEAPVHAVSFLLCVASGVYDGTPWHRVVPSFVIQGGDPHGTGNGDAGWSLPDEITRARFVRGALGMPKGNIRDTGGCQLFVMHSDYRPLDGRYTCYGQVVDGMETVDKIRVGDRIQGVKMVLR